MKEEKDEKKDEKQTKAKVVVTHLKKKAQYQVLMPKVDLKKHTGAIPIFFWVGSTMDGDQATMVKSEVTSHGLSIPCLKNTSNIMAGQQLLFLKEEDQEDENMQEEAPKRKSRKKA